MDRKKNFIIFICPYPAEQAPSQRFRFEQYFSLLKHRSFHFEIYSFWSLSSWKLLYKKGSVANKFFFLLAGFIKRFILLFYIQKADFVFIHREATPIGPPWFEWAVAKVFRKRIIYDFDDAIWLPNTSEENSLASKLKWHSKVSSICRWSYAVSCGNQYLCDFAKQFNQRVFLNPTTIDTDNLHNPALYKGIHVSSVNALRTDEVKGLADLVTIGWTGTHSTLKYIDMLLPVIQSLEKKFPNRIRFVAIADKNPSFSVSSFCFISWSKETEIQDLLQFDIGVMPLTDDVWASGKCGFKALQYMALGIPAIASPVGANSIIIDEGVNGFLCHSLQQWETALIKLIQDPTLRREMGERGRKKMVEHYSVSSNSSNFISLFE